MKHTIASLTAFAAIACSSLRPFSVASPCAAPIDTVAILWQCVASPGLSPKEGGLASTLRVATGDLTRRVVLNQTPSLSCNTRPWKDFEHVSQAVAGADRLEAFVHAGDAKQPVVLVVHGLYD